MVSIGIFSSEDKNMINKYLQMLFTKNGKKYMSLLHPVDGEAMRTLISSDIDYLIIDLESVDYDFVDIMILDSNKKSASEITRHICPSTHLIYNIDNGFPMLAHPHAISCGLSHQAAATISSVSDSEFIFCLQKPVTTLFGNYVGESELLVRPPHVCSEVEPALPAVACGIVCEVIKSDELTIE
jgi:hypothetical protein